MAARQRTSTGRKKVEIRRIESEEARKVCFSKRRMGLFNKLSELSTLCGAEVAAVAFSPGGKAFSLGIPSVESVLDRIRNSNSSDAQAAAAADGGTGDRKQALAELNRELGELRAKLAAIKARTEDVDKSLAKARFEGSRAAAWLALEADVSQMGDEDLAAFAAALGKVRADVAARAEQVLQEALLFGRPVHGGGGGCDFEFGGTSASSGMEMTQAQKELLMMMLEMPPPTEFAAGTEMTQQQEMMAVPPPTEFDVTQMMPQQQMMTAMPTRTGFFAGTEMMQQQQMMTAMPTRTGFFAGTEMMQQQQMMTAMPTRTGFFAGTEMMQQQQQMMTAMPPLLPTGFDAGTELMQQQQMMMAMPTEFAAGMQTMQQQQQQQQMMAIPPPPLLPGFAPEMETVHQGFGYGFPQ